MAAPAPIIQLDIPTMNLARSVEFYGSVFDWRIEAEDGGACWCDTGGDPAIQLRSVASRSRLGILITVATDDVAAAADRCIRIGGKIIKPVTQTPAGGEYVLTADPFYNVASIWKPGLPRDPDYQTDGRNQVIWIEIPTVSLAEGVEYYQAVFGWQFAAIPDYSNVAFVESGQGNPGVGLVGETGPERLTPYVRVDDLEGAALRVRHFGGKVLSEPTYSPSGQFFVFYDPDSNLLGAFKPAS